MTDQVVVYRARNTVNGHSYVGVTKRGLPRREQHHRYLARVGKGYLLQDAIRKYGDETVIFEVVGDFKDDLDLALVFEHELIAKEQPVYNIAPGGLGRTGPLRPEVREAMSARMRSKPGFFTGKTHSDEAKAKMAEAHRGKTGPWAGKSRPEAAEWLTKAISKPVMCLNDGNVFSSAAQADRYYGLAKRATAQVASGRTKSVRGLRFVYVEAQ